MTKLNALGAAGGAVAGVTAPETALIRSSSPGKNSSFSASSPAHAAIATAGRNWPSAADIADDKLGGASPWTISSFSSPTDVVNAVSSSSFLPCWSAPVPFYVYKNKPVIDGGFSAGFGDLCAAALNGTATGTQCVRVAGSAFIGPNVKQGNDDRSGKSCELPKAKRRRSASLRRQMLQMGVLPKAVLAAEDAWLSEIDRSVAADYPQQTSAQGASSSGSAGSAGQGAAVAAAAEHAAAQNAAAASAPAAAAAASDVDAGAAAAAASEASDVASQSGPSSAPPRTLNPLTESLTALSFAVAAAVGNATSTDASAAAAGAAAGNAPTSTSSSSSSSSQSGPSLPSTTPLCPKKENFAAAWPRLVNQTEPGGPAPSIYPGRDPSSPLPFTACEWQKLVLNLTPAVLPKVYAAGVADGAAWATENGFCGGAAGK